MLIPKRAMIAVVLMSLVLGFPGTAMADGGVVTCDPSEQTCDIDVDQPPTDSGGDDTSTGERVCRDSHDDSVVPCWRDDVGWYGFDECYYNDMRVSDVDLTLIGEEPRTEPGVWYGKTCFGGNRTTYVVVFLTQSPAPVVGLVALHATSRLTLPTLSTQASPAGTQLVRLPSWWWTAPASWRVQSATASVPGISVTATATPYKAVWDAGDGSEPVTCTGPGTAWTGGDALAASPTCGHTYQRSSASAPDGAFTLRTTVRWRISWAGGGATGAEPDLTTTETTRVRVAESQALITR